MSVPSETTPPTAQMPPQRAGPGFHLRGVILQDGHDPAVIIAAISGVAAVRHVERPADGGERAALVLVGGDIEGYVPRLEPVRVDRPTGALAAIVERKRVDLVPLDGA
jgi:hypothetical protein